MSDLISRQAAIDVFENTTFTKNEIVRRLSELPSAQLETSTKIQEILDYLDTALHPIVSPDNWYVYSELHDMVSKLPSAQPEQRWIPVDLQNNSPEENKVVLLGVRYRDDFKYFVTSRQDYNYWTGLGREIKGELRWQPLPSAYRKEGEE